MPTLHRWCVQAAHAASLPPEAKKSELRRTAFNIAQQGRIARSRLAGDPPDLVISPRQAEIGLFEFHRASETISLGHPATKKLLPEIQEVLAVHMASY
jgi:NTE family protein